MGIRTITLLIICLGFLASTSSVYAHHTVSGYVLENARSATPLVNFWMGSWHNADELRQNRNRNYSQLVRIKVVRKGGGEFNCNGKQVTGDCIVVLLPDGNNNINLPNNAVGITQTTVVGTTGNNNAPNPPGVDLGDNRECGACSRTQAWQLLKFTLSSGEYTLAFDTSTTTNEARWKIDKKVILLNLSIISPVIPASIHRSSHLLASLELPARQRLNTLRNRLITPHHERMVNHMQLQFGDNAAHQETNSISYEEEDNIQNSVDLALLENIYVMRNSQQFNFDEENGYFEGDFTSITVGFDHPIDDRFMWGVSLGYDTVNSNFVDSEEGGTKSTGYNLSTYGSYRTSDDTFLNMIIGASRFNSKLTNNTNDIQYSGETSVTQFAGEMTLLTTLIDNGFIVVKPFIGAQFIWANAQEYDEANTKGDTRRLSDFSASNVYGLLGRLVATGCYQLVS